MHYRTELWGKLPGTLFITPSFDSVFQRSTNILWLNL
jgi:hypothetical protein